MAEEGNNRNAGCPGFPAWPELGKRFVFAPGLAPGLRDAFRDAELLLRSARPVKVSRSTTAGIVAAEGVSYFVKRSNVPTLLDRVRRIGRLSRAQRNLLASERLAVLGIRVPKVLMALTTTLHGLPGPSYLVTEFLPRPMTVHEALPAMLERQPPEYWARKMAALMELLHRGGIVHGDLKMVNFLAVASPEEADGFTLGLLDFDGTKLGTRPVSRRARRKELARAVSSCFLRLARPETGGVPELETLLRNWCDGYWEAGGTDFRGDRKLDKQVRAFLERAGRRRKGLS